MKRVITVLLLALIACLPGVPQPQTSTNPVDRLRQEWRAAWNAGQLDRLAMLYADNAVLLPPDGQIVTGRVAIRTYFQRLVDQRKSQISPNSTSKVTINSASSEVSGDLGVDTGNYKETIEWTTTSISLTGAGTSNGRASKVIEGGYMVVVKRYKADWLIQQHAVTQKPGK